MNIGAAKAIEQAIYSIAMYGTIDGINCHVRESQLLEFYTIRDEVYGFFEITHQNIQRATMIVTGMTIIRPQDLLTP